MKTSELTGAALNWAVNHAERLTGILAPVNYCGKWEHGGPIIEREGIGFMQFSDYPQWTAKHPQAVCFDGPTPLIAAMRCYVASELGDDIEIPEELK
jgi:hypothetical protein